MNKHFQANALLRESREKASFLPDSIESVASLLSRSLLSKVYSSFYLLKIIAASIPLASWIPMVEFKYVHPYGIASLSSTLGKGTLAS